MANAREFLQDRVLLAVAVSVLGTPVMAGESRVPDAAAVPAGGAITYSRDVHHSIGSTYFPGQSHDAVTAPTGAIIGAIALGLAPLTDSETARVTASLPQTVEHAALSALAVSEQGALSSRAGGGMGDGEVILDRASDSITVSLPVLFAPRGSRTLVLRATSRPRQPRPVLIAALRKAHAMLRNERGMPMIDSAPRSPYDRAILRLAFLAPDIQRAILEGRQPTHLNLESLKAIDLPFAWSKQREVLGFASCRTSCSGDQIT